MDQDLKYLVRFNALGDILYSTAPFLDKTHLIGDVLPFFESASEIVSFQDTTVKAYEFEIKGIKYFIDFVFNIKNNDAQQVFELEIVDKTEHYLFYQKERTAKNETRIENDYLVAKNNRLQSKVNQLESFISDYILKNILIPVHNLKSSLEIIDQKFALGDINSSGSISKIIELSKQEANNLHGIIEQVAQFQKIANNKTFEATSQCSLREIAQGALINIQKPIKFEITDKLSHDLSVYVYKYHFTTIVENIIQFAITMVEGNIGGIEMSNSQLLDNTDLSINFKISGIKNQRACEKRLRYTLHGVGAVDDGIEGVGLLTVRKLVQLYQGNITTEFTSEGDLIMGFHFDSLLPQKKEVA